MNFFASDAFLQALAHARFANRRCEIADADLAGQRYRLLWVDRKPITEWPFLDFIEQPDVPSDAPAHGAVYLPRAVLDVASVTSAAAPALLPGQQPAPYVDWTAFPSWDAFEKHCVGRRKQLLSDTARRERKLAEALGEVRFDFHDPSEEAFDACVRWKSAQYIATGGRDGFFRENVPLFRELLARGSLIASTLRAGSTLLAVTWSFLYEGRFGNWVPAYDAAFATYSPGRLLLHRMYRDSHARGHRQFDLLIGSEEYKWHYATHVRVIAPRGQPPLGLRVRRFVKSGVRGMLAASPGLLARVRDVKRRWSR